MLKEVSIVNDQEFDQNTTPEECTHDCSTCGANCASREGAQEDFDFTAPLNDVSIVHHRIGVVSGKGGVGKSLVTSMLAVALRRKGLRTAILDADITGPSIPAMFGVNQQIYQNEFGILPATTKTGIDMMSINLLLDNVNTPVLWRGPIITGTVKQFYSEVVWDNIDYMFVDMPPGTGDVPLTVFQSIPLDGIIIVATPQELVGMVVSKAIEMAKAMNVSIIGIIQNMSYVTCPDCGKKIYVFGDVGTEQIASSYQLPLLARIPLDPQLSSLCDRGQIEEFEGDWLNEAADHILSL
ncbi:MAG: Mrp/NBP35 family ATP-binding protein [Clostridia bacterium]|nr:Mrp/NBP35 family ATP-binding protein [Clostridia bacterium]